MGIFKIFPEKDATIYSEFPNKNTGIDEILEIGAYTDVSGKSQVARTLIKFSQSDIDNVFDLMNGSNHEVYLRLYLANAQEIPSEYEIFANLLTENWEMGLGRYSNSPSTNQGVTWTTASLNTLWSITGSDYSLSFSGSQEFVYNDSKDIEMPVTSQVDLWADGADNNGVVLKLASNVEYNNSNNLILKYFSRDTHTIYPPALEFRWDDSFYSIGSGSTVANSNIVISLQNNGSTFNQSEIHDFRITVRDKYPVRVFQTSSVYSNYKFLPSLSYYAIRDMNTKEMVIDFDATYTKISADETGNYFKIYMNGLEPERYYSILIKSIIGGEDVVFDNEYYFKLIRGGKSLPIVDSL